MDTNETIRWLEKMREEYDFLAHRAIFSLNKDASKEAEALTAAIQAVKTVATVNTAYNEEK